MKDGLIVYLVGDSSLPAGFDVRAASRALGHRAQQVEMVAREEGFFSVEDAWHFLMTRGCGRINLLVGAGVLDGQRQLPVEARRPPDPARRGALRRRPARDRRGRQLGLGRLGAHGPGARAALRRLATSSAARRWAR